MRHKNLAGPVVCTILLIGLILYFAPSILPAIMPVKASSRTISLVGNTSGSYYYWNSSNHTITVTQGDTLTIDVSSSNSIPHKLLIDLDKDGYTDAADCGTADVCSNMVPPSYSIPPSLSIQVPAHTCIIARSTLPRWWEALSSRVQHPPHLTSQSFPAQHL